MDLGWQPEQGLELLPMPHYNGGGWNLICGAQLVFPVSVTVTLDNPQATL